MSIYQLLRKTSLKICLKSKHSSSSKNSCCFFENLLTVFKNNTQNIKSSKYFTFIDAMSNHFKERMYKCSRFKQSVKALSLNRQMPVPHY